MPRPIIHGWTTYEITERLAISTAIWQKARLGACEIADIRKAGIRRIEISVIHGCFDYHDQAQISEVIQECRKQDVTVVSFHTGRIPFGSEDENERQQAVKEGTMLVRTAMEMGVGVLTAHLRKNEATRRSIEQMLREIEGQSFVFGVENVGEVKVADAISLVDEVGSGQFKMLLDIGHARDRDSVNPFVREETARTALSQCGSRLCGLHLHETFPTETKCDHHPPMHEDGIIKWGEVFAGIKDTGYQGSLVFEDGRGENPLEWIAYTGIFPRRFIERYGK